MIDLEQRLSDAFQARADGIGPEHLAPAAPPAPIRRRGPVLAGLAASAAVVVFACLLLTSVVGSRAGDAGPAGPTSASDGAGLSSGVPDRVGLTPVVSGQPVSHADGTVVRLDGTVFRLERGATTWSLDLGHLGAVALTDLSVDLDGRFGYVLRQEVNGSVRPLVMVFEDRRQLVVLEWASRDVRPDLGPGDWTTWVGADGRLYSSRDGDAAAYRWRLGDPVGGRSEPVRLASLVLGQASEQRP